MNNLSFSILIPFICAFTYTLAAMLFKKALNGNINIWYINFLSNMGTLVLAFPFFFSGNSIFLLSKEDLLKPLLVSLIFLVGQIFSLLALKTGDVSVATPLLGTKIIFVAFLTVIMLHIKIPLKWWIASFLTLIAFWYLKGENSKKDKNNCFIITVLYSILSTFSFACCDVLIQKWAKSIGSGIFMALMFLIVALLSLGYIPFFKNKNTSRRLYLSLPLLIGVFFISFQAVGIGYVLAKYGNATVVNIVFSSRGVWSVVLVLFVGKYFGINEPLRNKRIFFERLLGSSLIFMSIVMVMI